MIAWIGCRAGGGSAASRLAPTKALQAITSSRGPAAAAQGYVALPAEDQEPRFMVGSSPMPMHTVETRWFLNGSLPAAVEEWFRDLGPTAPSSWETREDAYLVVPESTEIGIKARGESDAFEVKCRNATFGVRDFGGNRIGVLEGWIKWSHHSGSEWISTLTRRFPGVHRVWKSRLKRYYLIEGSSDWTEVPVVGAVERAAIVEVAKLRRGGAEYHSIAVEAFSADEELPGHLADHLTASLSGLLADIPARLSAESSMAYPEWLTGARKE